MNADSPREAEVGPWAREKLDALEQYLDYYTKRLKNQPWRTIFIDAFAGGGRAKIRNSKRPPDGQQSLLEELLGPEDPDQAEFILGSPRRSLEIANPFNSYIFMDSDPNRIRMLRELKAEHPDKKITIRAGSAEAELDWVLSKGPARDKHRGVAFLDPFGAHLEWRSVKALADTGVFEVLINFPLDMAINRLMKVDAQIPDVWRAQLDKFFPDGWWDHAYSTDPGLFDSALPPAKRKDARDRLLEFYLGALKDAFGYVSRPKLIRNTRRHPLYYLIWAGPHPAGLKGANYVLAMGEKLP